MKIAIGSDKSGFSAKEAIKAWLTESGIEFDDLGTTDSIRRIAREELGLVDPDTIIIENAD